MPMGMHARIHTHIKHMRAHTHTTDTHNRQKTLTDTQQTYRYRLTKTQTEIQWGHRQTHRHRNIHTQHGRENIRSFVSFSLYFLFTNDFLSWPVFLRCWGFISLCDRLKFHCMYVQCFCDPFTCFCSSRMFPFFKLFWVVHW